LLVESPWFVASFYDCGFDSLGFVFESTQRVLGYCRCAFEFRRFVVGLTRVVFEFTACRPRFPSRGCGSCEGAFRGSRHAVGSSGRRGEKSEARFESRETVVVKSRCGSRESGRGVWSGRGDPSTASVGDASLRGCSPTRLVPVHPLLSARHPMSHTLLVFVALATLSGCSAYSLAEPKAPPVAAFGPALRAETATVCVVRPSHFAVAVTFVVRDNGQLVGATRGESYFCYEAQPGRHAIASSTGDPIDADGEAALNAEAGKRYWLHQDYDDVLGRIVDRLAWIDETRARAMIDDCDYKTLSAVPGGEALPPPVPLAVAR
jgi:hypothetical protein